MLDDRNIHSDPIKKFIGAISVGIYKNEVIMDLNYNEDSQADTDMNIVMNEENEFIEIQGTAESRSFNNDQLALMLNYAKKGIKEITLHQKNYYHQTKLWIDVSRANKNKIVVATGNKGKLKEIRKYFDPFNCRMISQEELEIESIPETGDSFKSNALQKAVHLASYTNYPIIADDSGLVVDALNGEPGVYSARYAGDESNDDDNIDLLLERMAREKKIEKHIFTVL